MGGRARAIGWAIQHQTLAMKLRETMRSARGVRSEDRSVLSGERVDTV